MKEEATLIMAILLVILNIFSKNFYKRLCHNKWLIFDEK